MEPSSEEKYYSLNLEIAAGRSRGSVGLPSLPSIDTSKILPQLSRNKEEFIVQTPYLGKS